MRLSAKVSKEIALRYIISSNSLDYLQIYEVINMENEEDHTVYVCQSKKEPYQPKIHINENRFTEWYRNYIINSLL